MVLVLASSCAMYSPPSLAIVRYLQYLRKHAWLNRWLMNSHPTNKAFERDIQTRICFDRQAMRKGSGASRGTALWPSARLIAKSWWGAAGHAHRNAEERAAAQLAHPTHPPKAGSRSTIESQKRRFKIFAR